MSMDSDELKFDHQLKQVMPHVYHLTFESSYDLAMHFIRFQEYYESPKFYRQFFSLVDYMEWYAKDYENANGAFTYPIDWGGFNVPSHCLVPFLEDNVIPDRNKYDDFMLDIIQKIKEHEDDHPFYLIGTSTDYCEGLSHELAHALYTVDTDYHREANLLLQTLPPEILETAQKYHPKHNYPQSTIDDEIHAYCATGLCMLRHVINDDLTEPFTELFQKYIQKSKQNLT